MQIENYTGMIVIALIVVMVSITAYIDSRDDDITEW